MPTSNYMPDVRLDIAFNAGVTTDPASRTWTDVSTYVELAEGITITHGRGDQFSTCEPNQLTIVLDNTDGRFTPGKSSSPYYPNVKIGRPIRLQATPKFGALSTRFLGFIDDYEVMWPEASDRYATVKITARSWLSRLGEGQALRSNVEQTFLADSPLAYWPLGDAAGSTTAANLIASGQALTTAGSGAAVTFGSAIGIPTDGLTAATFAGGKYLRGALPSPVTDFTAECYFSGTFAADQVLIKVGSLQLVMSGAGEVELLDDSGGGLISAASTYDDGATHHAAMTLSGSTATLYVDGVSEGTAAVTTTSTSTVGVGGPKREDGLFLVVFTGVIAHAAVYSTVLSPSRIFIHAGLTSSLDAGDLAHWRITGYAGVTLTESQASGFLASQDYMHTEGVTALDALRIIEATHNAVLFDRRDNKVTMKGPSVRYNAPVAFTLDAATQQIEAGTAPIYDQFGLVNAAEVTRASGSGSSYRDATSIADYGLHAVSVSTQLGSVNDAEGLASWLVETGKEPTTRVGSLTFDFVAPANTGLQNAIYGADVNDRFQVTGWPAQMASTTGDYFIEGWTETYGPESCFFTVNVSDAAKWVNVFEIENNPRGTLDSIYRIAL